MSTPSDKPLPDIGLEPVAVELGTRADWVTRRLIDAILTGQMLPGERIHANRISELWNVSPTPLREAVQRLSSSGLVEVTPQRGARVASLSPRKAKELYELRLMLEPTALRDSILRFDDQDRALTMARFEAYARAWHDPDAITYSMHESHRELHDSLLRRCSSQTLLDIVANLTLRSMRYTGWMDPRQRIAVHRRLTDAACTGDVEGALAALDAHTRPGLEWALSELGTEVDEPATVLDVVLPTATPQP